MFAAILLMGMCLAGFGARMDPLQAASGEQKSVAGELTTSLDLLLRVPGW
jgi:hypothetical protein